MHCQCRCLLPGGANRLRIALAAQLSSIQCSQLSPAPRLETGIMRKSADVISLRVVLGACGIALSLVRVSEGVGEAAPPPLRLVALCDGSEISQVHLRAGRIVGRNGDAIVEVPSRARWRIDGDPMANYRFIFFNPEYSMTTAIRRDGASCWVHLDYEDHRDPWSRENTADSLVVFAWVLEGRLTRVSPVPVPSHRNLDPEIVYTLNEAATQGAPVILVYRDGTFVPPNEYFDNPAGRRLTAGMLLRSKQDIRSDFQDLPEAALNDLDRRALLETAAEDGVDGVVPLLLDMEGNARRIDSLRASALWPAAAKGRRSVIRTILSDVETLPEDLLWSLIETCLAHNHQLAACDLFDAMAEAKPQAKWTERVWSLAVESGATPVLGRMIDSGASPHRGEALNADLLTLVERDATDGIALLLQAGADPNVMEDGIRPLVAAAIARDTVAIEALLKAGAEVDATDGRGVTALTASILAGNDDAVRVLLDYGASLQRVDDDGATPLHVAVISNHAAIVSRLLDAGAELDARGSRGSAPLDLALLLGYSECAKQLVEHGARIDLAKPGSDRLIEGAIAFDLRPLLERAVEDGWEATKRFHQKWPVNEVCELYHATNCVDWCSGSGIEFSKSIDVGLSSEMTAPVPVSVFADVDARPRDRDSEEVVVSVSGVVDCDGTFRFPTFTVGVPDALVEGLRQVVTQWRFEPALSGGGAIATRVTVPIRFPGFAGEIHSKQEVDQAPIVRELDTLRHGRGPIGLLVSLYSERDMPYYGAQGIGMMSFMRGNPTLALFGRYMGGVGRYSVLARHDNDRILEAGREYVQFRFIVEPDGTTSEVVADRGYATAQVQRFATQLVENARFSPGIIDGKPVRTRMALTLFAR